MRVWQRVCACARKGINGYMRRVRSLCLRVHAHVRLCDKRACADGFIEARLCSGADRVASQSDCSYRRGSFVFKRRMWGRQAGCRALYSQSVKYRTGFGLFNFLPPPPFFWVEGGNEGFPHCLKRHIGEQGFFSPLFRSICDGVRSTFTCPLLLVERKLAVFQCLGMFFFSLCK